MKFNKMTVMCSNIEKLTEIYFNKCVNSKYVVDITDEENMCEIAKDKLEIIQINNIVILSVDEFCMIKDMIEELKANGLDAIILESCITTYSKKYIGFKTLDELIDFVINENKKFKFVNSTADELKMLFERDNNKATKLYEVSDDINILPDAVIDIFIF